MEYWDGGVYMRIIDFAFLKNAPFSSFAIICITSFNYLYCLAVSLGSMNEFTEFIFVFFVFLSK